MIVVVAQEVCFSKYNACLLMLIRHLLSNARTRIVDGYYRKIGGSKPSAHIRAVGSLDSSQLPPYLPA
jgi:hypothetical protein